MKNIFLFLSVILLSGCFNYSVKDSDVYTLYRNSPIDAKLRIHIATFDSSSKAYSDSTVETYNRENCEQGRMLYQFQPGIITRFYCEKGRYRK